ncbi:MAG: M1 family aminopeptidase, partial [Bacillota bacterium]|nr:M1 family aminopeptidase [Bacillota bacterium]
TSENVRDFAAVASDKFQIVKANIGGTVIKSYAFDKTKAEKVLNYSAKAIETFNKRFGEYPYSTCSVVQTDLQGGMEYPTMVMIISDSYTNITAKNIMSVLMYQGVIGDLEDVVVHELAHQWWYGLVGDNEYDEAWVDEPITQFSTLLYYKDVYGDKKFESMYNTSIKYEYNLSSASIKDTSFKRPLNEFTESDYEILVYCRAPMLIKEQYDKLGDAGFNEAFRQCFEKYKFKVLKGKDFPLNIN